MDEIGLVINEDRERLWAIMVKTNTLNKAIIISRVKLLTNLFAIGQE